MARILLMAFALCVGVAAWSQNTYFSNNFASAGDSFLVSRVSLFDLGNEDFSPTGPSQSWDFNNLYPYSQRIINFVTPNSTGFLPAYLLTCGITCAANCYSSCSGTNGLDVVCNSLCNAGCNSSCIGRWSSDFNLAELTNDSINLGIVSLTQVYNFYKKDQSGLYQNAIGARISNIPLVATFDSPDRVYRFPMRYGDSATSVSSYSIKLDSIPGTGINFSFAYKHAQTRTNYVDGWGTLVTPYATYDSVLKHKSIIHNRDSITILGNTITLGTFLPNEIIPDTVIEYSWFRRDERVPVLKVTAWLINGNEIYQQAEFLDSVRCFQPYAIFGYLPIPATLEDGDDSVEVNFYNLSFNANTFTWDFADSHSSSNVAQGQNPSHWYSEGGLYTVTLTICNTGCPAGWCKDVSLPVLVIDNRTVGIRGVSNSTNEWTIGPNPFNNDFSLEYKGSNTPNPTFGLFDLAGKRIALPEPERQNDRFHWQRLDYLPDGVYLLHIDNGTMRTAIRLVKMGR